MNIYTLRTTFKNLKSDIVLPIVLHNASAYIYCLEGMDSDNPHAHFYLETDYKMPAMRARLASVGMKGNVDLSFSLVKDKLKYIAYIVKSKNYFPYNISDSLLEEALSYDSQVKASIVNSKPSNRLERLISFYKSQLPSALDVVDHLFAWVEEEKLVLSRHQTEALYHSLLMSTSSSYVQSYRNRLFEQFENNFHTSHIPSQPPLVRYTGCYTPSNSLILK